MKRVLILGVALIVGAIVITSCGGSSGGSSSDPLDPNVTITINFAGHDTETVYLGIFQAGVDNELRRGSGVLGGGTVDITPSPGLPNGNYEVVVILDADGTGPEELSLDDYIVFNVLLTVTAGAGTLTINQGDFALVNLVVTVNFAGQEGEAVYAMLDTQGNGCNGKSTRIGGRCHHVEKRWQRR